MLNNLIKTVALVASEESAPFGDRSKQAGIVSLQGMLTIFLVLAIIWAAIEIMHAVVHRGKPKAPKAPKAPKPEKQKKAEQAAAPKQDDAAIAAAIAASLAAAEDNGALVAAITAAITAARAENGESGSFRVVSFKRAERRRGFGR